MSSRRTAKVAQAIREVVSSTILRELRDPRIQNVTVLGVEVPEDLRSAKVRISVLGDEKMERRCLEGLRSSKGFLQAKVADQIQLRYTPLLSFEVDEGVKKSVEATRILRELEEERQSEVNVDPLNGVDPESTDEEIDMMSKDATHIHAEPPGTAGRPSVEPTSPPPEDPPTQNPPTQ